MVGGIVSVYVSIIILPHPRPPLNPDFRKHLAGLTITEPLTYLDPVSLLFC